jgi:DNA repair protein RadC
MKAAGAKRTAETAELRKAGADRPQSQQRRGVAAGKGERKNCGRTAERLRKLSSLSSLASPPTEAAPQPAPGLVKPSGAAKPRKRGPAEAADPRGEGLFDEAPLSLVRGLPAHEQAVIDAALAILARRVREPGAVFDAPRAVREYVRLHLAKSERERFGVLFLDAQHALIAFEVLFEGTLSQASVYPREVVKRALQLNAAEVILTHNHPSGSAEPSRADEYLTNCLQTALQCIDVRVLDHVVVGWPDVVSFAERGLIGCTTAPAAPVRRATRRNARALANAAA